MRIAARSVAWLAACCVAALGDARADATVPDGRTEVGGWRSQCRALLEEARRRSAGMYRRFDRAAIRESSAEVSIELVLDEGKKILKASATRPSAPAKPDGTRHRWTYFQTSQQGCFHVRTPTEIDDGGLWWETGARKRGLGVVRIDRYERVLSLFVPIFKRALDGCLDAAGVR